MTGIDGQRAERERVVSRRARGAASEASRFGVCLCARVPAGQMGSGLLVCCP
jgi:hypothetical protein